MKNKLSYLREFDGLRAIAALMIMFFHFFQNMETSGSTALTWIRKISFAGQTGVTLFFVLSGFLITRILLNSKGSVSFFKPFYVRRSLRIFPLYFLFLFIYYFVMPALSIYEQVPAEKQWPYWVYMQNFAITFNWDSQGPLHFWSLAVEEHFYLFWPLVVYFLTEQNLKRLIYCIIVLAVLLRAILFMQGYEVFYFTFTNIDSLTIGALLALEELKRETFTSPKKYIRIFFIWLVPALGMWFLVSGQSLPVVQWLKFLVISIIYYSVLGYLLNSDKSNIINTFLRAKFLEFTGKISYGLYVYHPLCFFLGHSYLNFNNVFLNLIVSFIIAYVFATVSFFAFEQHFLKLKKYFNY